MKPLLLILTIMLTLLFTVACNGGEPEATEVAAKYSNEIAQAIIEGSWKVAGAIVLGMLIHAIIS